MTLDEASRLHRYEQARTALGDAAASTLMTWLPAAPDRLATTDDVDDLGTRLDTTVDALGVRLDNRIDVLSTQMDARFEVMDARFDTLEANLRRDIAAGTNDLLRTLFFAMVGTNATLVGLVFAAVRLG